MDGSTYKTDNQVGRICAYGLALQETNGADALRPRADGCLITTSDDGIIYGGVNDPFSRRHNTDCAGRGQ